MRRALLLLLLCGAAATGAAAPLAGAAAAGREEQCAFADASQTSSPSSQSCSGGAAGAGAPTSEPHDGQWIVRFTSYKPARLHRCVLDPGSVMCRRARALARPNPLPTPRRSPVSFARSAALEAVLGPDASSDAVAAGWSWVARENAAAAYPTDFALVR